MGVENGTSELHTSGMGRERSDGTSTNSSNASNTVTPPPQRRRTPLWTLKATQLLGTSAWACLSRFIAVFYAGLEVSRSQIGQIQFMQQIMSFLGQFLWAWVADYFGDYKYLYVCLTSVGTALVFLNLLPAVQTNFSLLCVVAMLSNLALSTGSFVDALCLTVVKNEGITNEGYGDMRLWCAVGWGATSLFVGQMIDMVGPPIMFCGFGFFMFLNVLIIFVWLPSSPGREAEEADARASRSSLLRQFLSFDIIWMLLNLFLYGLAMGLVENFLFVFLVQDFVGTTKLLLGLSIATMCAFEVPVFKYVRHLFQRPSIGLNGVIFICYLFLALRCCLYTLLPETRPWLVLLIEPLHGITFAAMWAATMEYGSQLAPPGTLARLVALINGIYYQASMAFSSMFWGRLVERPPHGLGFKHCFLLDAGAILVWCLVWQLGLRAAAWRRLRRRPFHGMAAADGHSTVEPQAELKTRDNHD